LHPVLLNGTGFSSNVAAKEDMLDGVGAVGVGDDVVGDVVSLANT
jgi:hypothetical protein